MPWAAILKQSQLLKIQIVDAVGCHLKTIPTPQNTGLEGVERLTLDLTPEAVESLDPRPGRGGEINARPDA